MLDNEKLIKANEHIKTLEATVLFLRNELYVAKRAFERSNLDGYAWLADKGINQSIELEKGEL
jgi:hypothetical protein